MQKKMMLVLLGLVFLATGCTRVDPGHVGIKVDYMGGNKGVDEIPVVTGFCFYNPISTKILKYPIYVQTYQYTHDTTEGKPVNEEFSFNDSDGMAMQADVSVSYQIDPRKAPYFYVKFRTDHLDVFTAGYLKNVIRDALSNAASQMSAEDILGKRKQGLQKSVEKAVASEVAKSGVIIAQLGFIGAIRCPIAAAMASKAQAEADAITAQNKVKQYRAIANQKVAEAEGEAKSNEIKAKSITPALLEWERIKLQQKAIDKWNGKMPDVMGSGQGMLFNIPTR